MKRITFTGSSFPVDGGFPVLGQSTRRTHTACIGGDGTILGLQKQQLTRQVLDEHVLKLNCHWWSLMHLHGKNPIQCPAFRVEINKVTGGMPVNPMTMTISLNQNAVLVPLAWIKFLSVSYTHLTLPTKA